MNRILIGGFVFLSIVAVMFYIEPRGQKPADKNSAPPGHGLTGTATSDTDSFDVTVTATADGFTPRDIAIKKGQRVRFLSESDEGVWPASGVHPTHTLYPEKESTDCLGSSFDACRDLKKGEFFDFTFNYVGEWRYHDHSHAYNSGSITVAE